MVPGSYVDELDDAISEKPVLEFVVDFCHLYTNVTPLPLGAPELEILDGLKLPQLLCAPEMEPALETSEHDEVTVREISLLVGSEHSSSVSVTYNL